MDGQARFQSENKDATMEAVTIEGKSVLVTGANRGLGEALVKEALRRGAAMVYAGTRKALAHADERVTPIPLDVTDAPQISKAVRTVGSLYVLVNNAGVSLPDALTDRAALEQHLAVNLYGTWGMIDAFLPLLVRAQGAIVNMVSLAAVAAVPMLPAYSISKAAAFSLSQSLRALAAGQGVSVHAVMAGPIDTDMVRDLNIPKASPRSVAMGIFDGLARGEEEIFPDPMSQAMTESWRMGFAKALERENAALVQGQPRTERR
jgi:NAD(P)-dependent dehydrogenase (short-subunit alcohol dehydrogenase family)